ncbi:4-hydroxybenzoate octaprenyltransferase [Formosimonas limnophila]|uniref:4-hydroxybenzoate octaprenyltransferase n=1 Tax=Formosimonas limnophila TaxID=1384487 RepID=A0A8J3FZ36_9BURK|nr:4-hydroxybenzoate octaprenyltransferase [Formosimonas limnophila]GHA65186.1 4-hydroxybenzoate octaprenyltransferase [Formosimonas limnophila]
MPNKLTQYIRLIRLDKPIGILLLLWPTLWGLWLAAGGMPPLNILFVFVTGTILMRSAGCAINDFADRDFDKHVARTKDRPLTSGQISSKEAVSVAILLALVAGGLALTLNVLSIKLAVVAAILAASYPFFKRFFAIPQAYLGIAFGFGIPMAFAAIQNQVPVVAWWLLLANVFWTIAYDTEYAMVDKEDDLKIGIKTSAITFGCYDVVAVMVCYALFVGLMAWVGILMFLSWPYFIGLLAASILAIYHYTLIRTRARMLCFKAFLHNHWLGAAVFVGTLVSLL